MIIESIALEGVRHFRNRIEIPELKPGLNIIVGPNGTGKSTVVDALVAALVQSHKSTGDGLRERLQHVAFDLTPMIEVTLRHAGSRYRLRKTYLKNHSARLERHCGAGFEQIKDSDDVETWLDEALALDRPARGMAKSDQYGLGALLWSRQAEPRLKKLPMAQAQRLQTLVAPGSAVVSLTETQIRGTIDERFHRSWVPKGTKYASGKQSADIGTLEEAVEDAQKRCNVAAGLVESTRSDRGKLDDIGILLQTQQDKRAQQRERLTGLKTTADQVRSLDSDIALAEEAFRNAEGEFGRLSRERTSVMDAQERIKALVPADDGLTKALAIVEARIAEIDATIAEAIVAQNDARGQQNEIEEEARQIADARYVTTLESALLDLERRLRSYAELRAQQGVLREKIVALLAPDDPTWAKIQQAVDEQREASQRIENESLSLRLTPERAVTFVVRSGSPVGERTCQAGDDITITGIGVIEIAIPTLGVLRLSSPTASADELFRQKRVADDGLAALLAPYGGLSGEELVRRRVESAGYGREQANVESRLSELLAREKADAFVAKVHEQRARRDALLKRYPDWKLHGVPDADALERALEPRREQITSAWDDAVSRLESGQDHQRECHEERSRMRREREELQSEITALRERIRLADELFGQHDKAALEEGRCKASLGGLRAQRAEIEGDPVGEYERLEAADRTLSTDIEQNRSECATLKARLETHAANGVAEVSGEMAARLESAERNLRREKRVAASLKLLKVRIDEASRAIGEAVNQPLAAQATGFARRIMQRDDLHVGFEADDNGLMRLSLGKDDWGGRTIGETVSGGESEQIELAVRLAMGSLLAKDEPQVVILDDALAFCDPVRLYRVLEILAEMEGEGLQVILTGCDTDRFASMPKSAHRIDLAALARQARSA